MRKVIPYIASQFRKDKIWLRRTKPSKRNYQICLAVDDSSSMVDNHSKQVQCPKIALDIKSHLLNTCEVGLLQISEFHNINIIAKNFFTINNIITIFIEMKKVFIFSFVYFVFFFSFLTNESHSKYKCGKVFAHCQLLCLSVNQIVPTQYYHLCDINLISMSFFHSCLHVLSVY